VFEIAYFIKYSRLICCEGFQIFYVMYSFMLDNISKFIYNFFGS